MQERRPLVEGLKPVNPPLDPKVEKQFVFGEVTSKEPEVEKVQPVKTRAPLTTKIRSDFATALKRASLERQLNGTVPNTLQEMLEEALEPWLKKHGYVP
jgi:hypothetical protein